MNCLVTGATGYIGNSLIQRLCHEDNKVIGLIHKTKPNFLNKNVKYVYGDITDKSSFENFINDVNVIFHCAALVNDFGKKEEFNKINYEGTKNIVEVCNKNTIKRFVYLGHIRFESYNRFDFYSLSKYKAEQYLIDKHKKEKFPVVIIRPGHVYGPGATNWVIRIIKAINNERIALINSGNGIFHHLYIDNLIDALISAMNEKKVIGKQINITDGDNSINWKTYINDLAKMIDKKPINKNISKRKALMLSNIMIIFYFMVKIKPWITPTVVEMLTNQKKISINNAKILLKYQPRINYSDAMTRIENWIKEEKVIK